MQSGGGVSGDEENQVLFRTTSSTIANMHILLSDVLVTVIAIVFPPAAAVCHPSFDPACTSLQAETSIIGYSDRLLWPTMPLHPSYDARL